MNLTTDQYSQVFGVDITKDLTSLAKKAADLYEPKIQTNTNDIAQQILEFKCSAQDLISSISIYELSDANIETVMRITKCVRFWVFCRSEFEDYPYATVNITKLNSEKVNSSNIPLQHVLKCFLQEPRINASIDPSNKYIHVYYERPRDTVCETKTFQSVCYGLEPINDFRIGRSPRYTDIKIIVPGDSNSNNNNDTEFPAHRVVLAANSTYFDVMFSNDMKESSEPVIKLQDITAGDCELLLDAIYGDFSAVTNSSLEELEAWLELATYYEVPKLEKLVMSLLLDQIDVNKSLDLIKEIYIRAKSGSYLSIQNRVINILTKEAYHVNINQFSFLSEELDIPQLQSKCCYLKAQLNEKMLELAQAAMEGDNCAKYLMLFEFIRNNQIESAYELLMMLKKKGLIKSKTDSLLTESLKRGGIFLTKRHLMTLYLGDSDKTCKDWIAQPDDPTDKLLLLIGMDCKESPYFNKLFEYYKEWHISRIMGAYLELANRKFRWGRLREALAYFLEARERGCTVIDENTTTDGVIRWLTDKINNPSRSDRRIGGYSGCNIVSEMVKDTQSNS